MTEDAGDMDGPELCVGTLTVDRRRGRATVAGRPLALAPRELALLAHLAARAGQVQSRTVLLTAVWGLAPARVDRASNVVDAAVRRLRRQLGAGDAVPTIATVRGSGYVLRPASDRSRADAAPDAGGIAP